MEKVTLGEGLADIMKVTWKRSHLERNKMMVTKVTLGGKMTDVTKVTYKRSHQGE